MTDAHLHLIVNHFPIIGTIIGLGILITGIIIKNNIVKNTAYVIFIFSAIFAFASMFTGEGAEEMVEDMPSVGKKIIHEHEEIAEKLAIVTYLLGLLSIAGLYTNIKNHVRANVVSYAIMVVAVVAVIIAKEVGTSGGEIRHTEIRENTLGTLENAITNPSENNEEDKD